MIIINTVDTERFSLDGIEYYKNFTPVVAGDTLRLQNTYNDIHLFQSTNFADITVDGTTFASSALLQSALLPVIYTRNSLGAATPDSPSVTTNIAATYDLDWSKGNSNLTMTANTVFSEINLPPSGVEKTITIYLYGVFSATLPVAWGVIGDAYDGVNGSQIVVHWKGDGTYHAVRNNLV